MHAMPILYNTVPTFFFNKENNVHRSLWLAVDPRAQAKSQLKSIGSA
jgi:hypothetical protein